MIHLTGGNEAMVEVHQSRLPPTIRWISHQIFLRTIWTKVKQSLHGRNEDDRCLSCNMHPKRTAHSFYNFSAVTYLWNQLRYAFKLSFNSNLRSVEQTR